MERYFSLLTYGCQMNKHDSERIRGVLLEMDFLETSNPKEADIILLNTCSIREKAEQKVFSQLGRFKGLKRKRHSLLIGVAGCIAQARKEDIFKKAPYVDIVLGPNDIDELSDIIATHNGRPAIRTSKDKSSFANKHPIKRYSRVQGWVTIMKGCNNYCSYCVVPYTRGREMSRPKQDIIKEVMGLVASGYKEITLLGQNVNSYGNDLDDGVDFPLLLEELDRIKGLDRIRFITSHPKDFSDRLIGVMKEVPSVCESLHLPIQAGSDNILRLMNRGYTAKEYIEKIENVRKDIPEISITTDIIVGFPSEMEKDYQDTKRLVQSLEFDGIFLFKYSKRPETVAASLSDNIDEETKSRRFSELFELQKEIISKRHRRLKGSTQEVLVEGPSKKDINKLTGRTRSNKIVNFNGSSNDIGKLVEVEITGASLYALEGKIINTV